MPFLESLQEAAIPAPDWLIQVRTGKTTTIGPDGPASAIFKEPHDAPIFVGRMRIGEDERNYPPHHGSVNAVHQYCASHYALWRKEKPEKADMFQYGAFGENLVTAGLNENNVCLGDVFRVGDEVLLEVSEPRLPCFKLNHRFKWPHAAKRVQKTGRIGWYLSVLQTGLIKKGDRVELVERPNPRWSVMNAARLYFSPSADPDLMLEFSNLRSIGPHLAEELRNRASGKAEDVLYRTQGKRTVWRPYQVAEARLITPRVRQLVLRLQDQEPGAEVEQFGIHGYAQLRFGPEKCYERSYSVVAGDLSEFTLGIAFDDHSRGGSKYLHQSIEVGDSIQVAKGVDTAEEVASGNEERIERRIFILGGIGVTAFLRLMRLLEAQSEAYEVHYAVRSMEEAAYTHLLNPKCTHYYAKDQKRRLNIDDIVPPPSADGSYHATVAACGPQSLMDACEARTKALGYPSRLLHYESFGSVGVGQMGVPFEIEAFDLDTENKCTVEVSAEKTLLQTLREAGFDVPSSCLVGRCGICVVNLKAGEVNHKGTALSEEEKCSQMLSCVSRGTSKISIEIE